MTQQAIKRVPAWAFVRMLRSLQAAGHSQYDIAHGTGLPHSTIYWVTLGRSEQLNRNTADRITEYWDNHQADKERHPTRIAEANKWVPPSWWDNITDPSEEPGVTHCRKCHGHAVHADGECRGCYEGGAR